jgi:hypothetical protein
MHKCACVCVYVRVRMCVLVFSFLVLCCACLAFAHRPCSLYTLTPAQERLENRSKEEQRLAQEQRSLAEGSESDIDNYYT